MFFLLSAQGGLPPPLLVVRPLKKNFVLCVSSHRTLIIKLEVKTEEE